MAISPRRKLDADDTSGPLEAISETTPLIDEVPKMRSYRKLFEDEKFMAERVTIVLHPGMDQSEIGVPISVNGKRVYLIPGRPLKIPRTHVAQLMKARPDYVQHRSDDYAMQESDMNRMYRQSTSRYNFEVLEDTPEGISWLRDLRSQYTKR